ncbi:MAG: hypothetical protein ABR922_16280 [Streptosporangiaceae bacterium]
MYYSTQPAIREQFITGLRELAAYLDAHPAMPVPTYGTDISVHTDHTEDGGRGQVAHIAAMLGATITDDTRNGGHLTAPQRRRIDLPGQGRLPGLCLVHQSRR